MPFGTSLPDYAGHVLARMEKNNDNVKIEEMLNTTLSGNPAIRLVTTTSSVTETYSFSAKTMQVLTLYGNLAYIIEYHGDLESYDIHHDRAVQAFRTVSIMPPISYAQLLTFPLLAGLVGLGAVLVMGARKEDSRIKRFLLGMRRMLPFAFGIEVLCVASAELGGLVALYVYGFNSVGILMAYVLAYGLAGFATFVSILGRGFDSKNETRNDSVICGCMDITSHSVSQRAHVELTSSLRQTFVNFGTGLSILPRIHKLNNAKAVIKASLLVLLSAESGCIIAAATVDVMLYQYSIFLSIPIALLAGTITVACLASYRSMKQTRLLSHRHVAHDA
jgi:hypothetical protein